MAFPFSRGSSRSRNQTRISCIADGFFTGWATREALEWTPSNTENLFWFWTDWWPWKYPDQTSCLWEHGWLMAQMLLLWIYDHIWSQGTFPMNVPSQWLSMQRIWASPFPYSSVDQQSACNARDPSLIPGLGRSTGEGIGHPLQYSWASLVAQLVENLPAMWETWVWSLCQKDPLEKEKATHSSILAGEFHGLYSPWGHKESDTTERLSLSFLICRTVLMGSFGTRFPFDLAEHFLELCWSFRLFLSNLPSLSVPFTGIRLELWLEDTACLLQILLYPFHLSFLGYIFCMSNISLLSAS